MADNSMLNALKGTIPPDTMPFGVGGPAEPTAESAAPGMVGSVLHGLFNIPKHLIDASANAVPGLRKEDVTDNPNAPEPNQPMYNASMKTAVDLASMGMPMAEAGAAGSFGGRMSATADHRMADLAERLEARGTHPEDIRRMTGWERNPTDDLWRYEIPDNKLRLNFVPDKGKLATAPAGHMFTDPDVFAAYPQLKDMVVSMLQSPKLAGWQEKNRLHMEVPNYKEGRSVAAHELQHAIQRIEGFANGSSQRYWRDFLTQNNPEFQKPIINESRLKNETYEGYRRTAGEVEARNVQDRLDYTPLERLMRSPVREQFAESPMQFVMKPASKSTDTLGILRALKYDPRTGIIRRLDQ